MNEITQGAFAPSKGGTPKKKPIKASLKNNIKEKQILLIKVKQEKQKRKVINLER